MRDLAVIFTLVGVGFILTNVNGYPVPVPASSDEKSETKPVGNIEEDDGSLGGPKGPDGRGMTTTGITAAGGTAELAGVAGSFAAQTVGAMGSMMAGASSAASSLVGSAGYIAGKGTELAVSATAGKLAGKIAGAAVTGAIDTMGMAPLEAMRIAGKATALAANAAATASELSGKAAGAVADMASGAVDMASNAANYLWSFLPGGAEPSKDAVDVGASKPAARNDDIDWYHQETEGLASNGEEAGQFWQ